MTMTQPATDQKILLLDVMSTLVSEPFYEDIPNFLGLSLSELREVRDLEAFHEFEVGHLSEAEYAQRYFKDNRVLDTDGLKATLLRSVQFLPGVESTLKRLKQERVQMHTLSNYSIWYQVIDEAVDLSRYVPWTFVSCKTGVRKPAKEAYLAPLKTLGVSPSECLFVDDRPQNVEAAEKLGIESILRTPELDLEQALIDKGVLS